MRISIVTLTAIITLLAINSDAAEVLRAYDHAAQCGTYEYYAHTKALQMGEFYDETDFKTSLHLVSPLEKNRLGKKRLKKNTNKQKPSCVSGFHSLKRMATLS